MTLQEKRTMMLSLIDRWKESGMSQVDFAQVQQVSLAKLRYWISKLRKDQGGDPAFIELNNISLPVVSIRYPNGVELSLPAQTSVVILRSLVNL